MNNLFDDVPDQEPAKLVAGERWSWTRSDVTQVYPTDDYTLSYLLRTGSATGSEITITAGKVSGAHVVEVSKTTTASYAAGEYYWQAIITRASDSEEVVIGDGYFEIAGKTGDTRSHTLKVLEAVRATLQGTASKDQQEYSINGRSLKRRSIPELMELEKYYSARWQAEKAKINRANGRSVTNKTLVQMSA